MRKSISFIIVAYHPKKEEFGVLLKLLKDYPTIIIDNGGTLTSDDVGKATLLTQTKNLGFGAAANIGIRHASARGAEWFVILNQDTGFSKESVRTLVAQLNKTPPAVAGPFTGMLDDKRWTTVLPAERTEYVTGSCMAIHVDVVTKIGYFYEQYFLYYEDADYCVKAKRAGFPILKLDNPDMRHEETMSLGKGSVLHQYYLARNHFLFVRRLAPASVKLYEVIRFAKTVGEHLVRKEWGALRGVRDYVLRKIGAYEHRN